MSEHRKPARLPRNALAFAAAGLLVLGGAGGALVMAETRPAIAMAPAAPVAIRTLSSGIVTVRGRVAEVYGNKFTLDDGTGRALIDTGREGDRRTLATVGETLTVQGRFERGFVHAAFLVGPDRTVTALGPLAGPPHGPHGPHEDRDRGLGAPPPPADGKAPPPMAAAPAPAAADKAG